MANAAVLEDIIIDGANEAAFATTTMPLLVLPPLPLFMMDKTAASISTADDDDEVEQELMVIMDQDRFALLLLVADIGTAAAGAIVSSISNTMVKSAASFKREDRPRVVGCPA